MAKTIFILKRKKKILNTAPTKVVMTALGGTADGTMVAVDSTSLATVKSTAEENFKELNTKLNEIIDLLATTGATV